MGLKVAIAGAGVVGGSLGKHLFKHGHVDQVGYYDPPIGYSIADVFKEADVCFICVPVPTLDSGDLDKSILREVLSVMATQLQKGVPIYIRSTILPGTCESLSKEFDLNINHMPEFLTERIAELDMERQDHLVVGGHHDFNLLNSLFPSKHFIFVSNREAELCKYVHNCHGALLVNFFNIIHEVCEDIEVSYEKVIKAASNTGYINNHYTRVPGPDGKFGFGGKCFPKDLKAFAHGLPVQSESLKKVMDDNKYYRQKL